MSVQGSSSLTSGGPKEGEGDGWSPGPRCWRQSQDLGAVPGIFSVLRGWVLCSISGGLAAVSWYPHKSL